MTAVNLLTEIKDMLDKHLKEDGLKNSDNVGVLKTPTIFLGELPVNEKNDFPFIVIMSPTVTIGSDEIKYAVNIALGVTHLNKADNNTAFFEILNLSERVARILDRYNLPTREFILDGKIEIEYEINPRATLNSLAGVVVNYKRVKSNF